jgi:hypothetical protein
LEQIKTPILIFKVEPVLDKLEKILKPLGPTHQSPGLNNGAACADRVWTTATTVLLHPRLRHRHHSAHSLRRHRPLFVATATTLRAWYEKLDGTLRKLGFHQSEHEHAVYCRRSRGGGRLIVGVYVDDLVIIGTMPDEIARFKEEMEIQFKMADLGLLSFYLGLEVEQVLMGSNCMIKLSCIV